MNFVKFDPGLLMESLEECNSLEILELDNVLWNGEFQRRKIQLPKLERFKLNRLYSLDVSNAEELMSLIFFNKNQTNDGKLERYSLKHIEVGFTANGSEDITTRLEMYLKNITRGLEIYNVSGDVLQYFNQFKFNVLIFNSTTLNINHIPKRLRELTLTNSDIINGNVSSLKEVASTLETISIWKYQKTDIDLRDLSFQTLKTLELRNLTLQKSSSIDNLDFAVIKFPNLTKLELVECTINSDLDLYFRQLSSLLISDVSFDGENASDFFIACEKLENLTMKSVNLDISVLPRNITSVKIFNSTITHSLDFKFDHLNTLYIDDYANFDEDFNFFNTFKHLKTLTIDRNISASLFLKLLDSFDELVELHVGFDRDAGNQPGFQEVTELLKDLEVPDSENPFKLEKFNGVGDSWSYKVPEWNNKLYRFFYFTYPIMIISICCIGILGNILSAIVLFSKEMRSSTSCILLGLVFCDTLLLVSSVILAPLAVHSASLFGRRENLDHDNIQAKFLYQEPVQQLHIFLFYPLSKTGKPSRPIHISNYSML